MAQLDAEVLPVGGEYRRVGRQLLLGARAPAGADQRAAAERDPAVRGEQGADRCLPEVRLRPGLLPPAGGLEFGQLAGPALDPVLGLAVLGYLDVAFGGVVELEGPGPVGLRTALVEQQRIVAVAAEADVGQPRPAAVGRGHDQRQVVERRPEPVLSLHPRGDPADRAADRLEQQRERAVELVAEAAAPPGDDLVEQVSLGQRDRLGKMDAQVLERHRPLMRPVQFAQRGRVGGDRAADLDAAQVGGENLVVHGVLPKSAELFS